MVKQTIKSVSIYGVLAALGLSAPLHAAPVYADAQYDFDFTTKTVGTSGASLTYSANAVLVDPADTRDIRSATLNAVVTSWSIAGTDTSFASSTAHQTATGIGVCNTVETSSGLQSCIDDEKNASVDNFKGEDWLLVIFSDADDPANSPTMDLSQLIISPDLDSRGRQQGRGVTYYTGIIDPNTTLNGLTYSGLAGVGLTQQFDVANGKSVDPATMTLADYNSGQAVFGNAILIGANVNNGNDRPLLTGMTTVVPVPPAIWLFGSALGAVFLRHRKPNT